MCLVLGASQCFAISGGPFGGGSQVTVTGTYAGVFVPIPTVLDPGPPPVTMTDNSLALFTLKIPKTGLASGVTAVFRNGLFYSGTIQGSADPDSAKLTGVVNSSFQETVATTSTTTFVFEYDANGQFVNAKIVANPNVASSATTRIKGRASLTYRTDAPDPNCTNSFPTPCPSDPNGNSGGPIDYKIHGFKQSEVSS